jgi:hypothetical protein
MRPRTILNLLALTVVVACVAAPVAAASIAQRGDLVSPDARDVQPPPAVVVGSDLRSPDARDVALGRTTSDAPSTVVVTRGSSSGFDWADASIGAGIVLAIVVLGGGMTVLLMHRRRSPAAS